MMLNVAFCDPARFCIVKDSRLTHILKIVHRCSRLIHSKVNHCPDVLSSIFRKSMLFYVHLMSKAHRSSMVHVLTNHVNKDTNDDHGSCSPKDIFTFASSTPMNLLIFNRQQDAWASRSIGVCLRQFLEFLEVMIRHRWNKLISLYKIAHVLFLNPDKMLAASSTLILTWRTNIQVRVKKLSKRKIFLKD